MLYSAYLNFYVFCLFMMTYIHITVFVHSFRVIILTNKSNLNQKYNKIESLYLILTILKQFFEMWKEKRRVINTCWKKMKLPFLYGIQNLVRYFASKNW